MKWVGNMILSCLMALLWIGPSLIVAHLFNPYLALATGALIIFLSSHIIAADL